MYKIGEKLGIRFKDEPATVKHAVKNVQKFYAGHNHAYKEMGTCTYILRVLSTGEDIEVTGNYLDLDNAAEAGLVQFDVNGKKQYQWGETIYVRMEITPAGVEWRLAKDDDDGTWNFERNAIDDPWTYNENNYDENYDEGDDPRFFDDHEFVEVHHINGKKINYPLDDEFPQYDDFDEEEYEDEDEDDY